MIRRWFRGGYCSITVANHSGTWLIRFVSKNYTHPWKDFVNKLVDELAETDPAGRSPNDDSIATCAVETNNNPGPFFFLPRCWIKYLHANRGPAGEGSSSSHSTKHVMPRKLGSLHTLRTYKERKKTNVQKEHAPRPSGLVSSFCNKKKKGCK